MSPAWLTRLTTSSTLPRAHVARLQLRIRLEELTQRFVALRPMGEPRYEAKVFVETVEQFHLRCGPAQLRRRSIRHDGRAKGCWRRWTTAGVPPADRHRMSDSRLTEGADCAGPIGR